MVHELLSHQLEFIPMGIQQIPIPIRVVSHSLPFPFLRFIPIPMGIPILIPVVTSTVNCYTQLLYYISLLF